MPEPTPTQRLRAQHALYPIHRTAAIDYEELNREAQLTVDKAARLIAEVQEEFLTAVETLDHRVLHAWAEAGDDPRGRGYAMGLSVAAAAVGRPEEIWASPERAENVKAEIERLRDQKTGVELIRELHKPYGIYDGCNHDHQDEDEPGVVEVDEIGLTCDEGLMYRVCVHCCLTGKDFYDYQHETCATDHKHGKDEPICATIDVLDNHVPVNH